MPSTTRSSFVIINPAAGRRRGTTPVRRYLELLRRYLGSYDHAETRVAGDEVGLADSAIERGYESIIAIGGDGTWGSVADRIVRSERREVTLGLLPSGTGNDFGKSLGVRADRAEHVVRGIAERLSRRIDVGRVGSRYFLNVVGFGFDIAVIDDAARFPFLTGDALYRFCALRQLFRFKGLPIRLTGTQPAASAADRRLHLMLTISNGNFFGGSFHIAPDASLTDGMLDAVAFLNVGPVARAIIFSRVAKGRHAGHPKVAISRAPRFTIDLDTPVRYEIDGDVFATESTTLRVEAVPRALSVYVPVPSEM